MIVRVNKLTEKRECLLVERHDEPVKGHWWFPGGRILKGETFFQAALRKTYEETGLRDAASTQVLGVFNTFFKKSNWEAEGESFAGTQTMNVAILVEVSDDAEILVDHTIDRFRWTEIDDPKGHEDAYIRACLKRLTAWEGTFSRT